MCGIFGFVGKPNLEVLQNGLDEILHRGPDSEGQVLLDDKVHFGHRRLSIIDLTESGHQPMISQNQENHIIFNGEIYNYKSIKKLLNANWRGHSDTEVILEAFSAWGIEKTLSSMTGMFSLAFYNSNKRILTLARDRFGEKPLYYGLLNNLFIFGSEIKSFKRHPEFIPVIDRVALKSYFRYSYVPAPLSIFQGIYKLEPGHYIELNIDTLKFEKKCYWDFAKLPSSKLKIGFTEASLKLEEMLKETIKNQMISDVPLGAFLSGGVDSSTVVGIMQSVSTNPINTFSIGFNEKNYNEAHFAKEVANHLRTNHHELYVSPKDALEVVPKLSHIYDEPFADSSQIPTYLVSAMTKKHVTVALSGDAGDEVFGGYNRYFLGSKIAKSVFWAPQSLRGLMSKALTTVSPSTWDKMSRVPGDKIHKLANILSLKDSAELYDRLISHWSVDESPVLGDEKSLSYSLNNRGITLEEKMMVCDSLTYLPDDILVKVDRASMAVSLESRVPFLDHNIVEFANSLPMDFKIHNGNGKIILKDVLNRYVPNKLIDRPKMGFGVPIEYWLRNELKSWAESLIEEKKIREQGLLDYKKIKEKWDEHQSGKRNWQYHLWDVLMFQDWYENSFIR